MTSKLSVHYIGDPTAGFDNLRLSKAKVAKVFEWESDTTIAALKGIVPFVVYRKYFAQDYTQISPEDFVAALPSKLFGLGLLWEGVNEPVISTVAQAQALNAWYTRFASLMHSSGERVAAFSFSTGNPPLELVPYLAEAAAASDYIALHEYYHPDAGYSMIGRYTQFLAALPPAARRQVVITETGFDSGGGEDSGWLANNVSPTNYLLILGSIDAIYHGDNWLVAATIFQQGGGKPWEKFNIQSIATPLAQQIAAAGGGEIPPMPTVAPAPSDPYLASFPRPANDNGRGLHFCLDTRQSIVDQYVPIMKALQVKWTTVYGLDENVTTNAALALLNGAGCYSVIRVEARLGAPKATSFWQTLTTKAISMKLPPYIQLFNEPEIEWDTPDHFAQMWNARAAVIVANGGYPGLQTMSQEFFNAAVAGMSADVKKKFFYVLHNYGANHPLEYPYNKGLTPLQDDTCVLRFFAVAEWAKAALGYVMPIIGGEGGYQYENADDKSLPALTADQWVHWNYTMLNWFRTGLVPGPNGSQQNLPDYLFSITPWLIYASNWYSDSWYFGLDADKKKPLTDALTADTPYLRQFNGNAPVPTTNFSLTPTTITLGQSATLTWSTSSIQAIYLNGNGIVGQGSEVITPTTTGTESFTFHVVYVPPYQPATKDFTLTLTVNPVNNPPPTTTYIDPRCPWVTVTNGTAFKVLRVDFRDSQPVDFPQSQLGVNIYAKVIDRNGQGITNVLVELHNGGVAKQWTVYGETIYGQSGDSSFDPKLGQVGPYSIVVGDSSIKGMGLPLKQHVEYVLLIQMQ